MKDKEEQNETVIFEVPVAGVPLELHGTVNEASEWLVEPGYLKSEASTSAKVVAVPHEADYELQFKKGE